MLLEKRDEIWRGRFVLENVGEAVATGCDGITRAVLRADVDDRHFFAVVSSGDDRGKLVFRQRGDGSTIGAAIVINDLDVIAAFGDAGVDERLGVGGAGEHGNGNAVLGAVTLRDGDKCARGSKVRSIEILSGGFAFADERIKLGVGEHGEFGGYSEDERLLKGVGPGVGVGGDQAREECVSGCVDLLCTGATFGLLPMAMIMPFSTET